MRRILLLITDLQLGGTPTVVRELALRLTSAGGAQMEVVCLSPWGPVADQISQGGIRVTAFNAKSSLSFGIVVARLVRLIGARKFDTVISFLLHGNAAAAAASFFCPGTRFLQSIQTTQPNPRWHWRVQSIIQRAAENIVVHTPSVAMAAREWARVPAGKISVIPNAVPSGMGILPMSSPETFAGTVPEKHGQDTHATVIGFIGRLDPIKRIGDLLQAMTRLEESIHLHIFGEGAERHRIEETIARLNLAPRVTLHGAVPGSASALAQIDLLVLPSQAEGFGLVLIEAMAAGIPVVATDVPGIRDVVRHRETGWLVPVASPEKLAEGISLVLNDPILRAAMIAQALTDVRARFSWETVLPQYQELLRIGRIGASQV